MDTNMLTLSWRRPLSYRSQSIDLLRKSMDWFLYDSGLRHGGVNCKNCPSMLVLVCIKQHLSNISSSIYEKVKQHWGWLKKRVAYKKRRVSQLFSVSPLSSFAEHKKWRISLANVTKNFARTCGLVIFTEQILDRKFCFLCYVISFWINCDLHPD